MENFLEGQRSLESWLIFQNCFKAQGWSIPMCKKLSRCQKGQRGCTGNSWLSSNTEREYREGRSRAKLPRRNTVTLPELAGMELGKPNFNWSWKYRGVWRGFCKYIDRKRKDRENMGLLLSEAGQLVAKDKEQAEVLSIFPQSLLVRFALWSQSLKTDSVQWSFACGRGRWS